MRCSTNSQRIHDYRDRYRSHRRIHLHNKRARSPGNYEQQLGAHLYNLLVNEKERFMLTHRLRGFSLIELAVVLVIVSILAMLAAPGLGTWSANAQVRATAESLKNDLRQAQAESIRRNRQVALILTNSVPGSATIAAGTTAGNWDIRVLPLLNSAEGANTTSGTTTFIKGKTQIASSGMTVTGDVSAICFNSVGRLASSTAAIADAGGATCAAPTSTNPRYFRVQNTRTDRPLWIQVYLGGQVRMCDPNKTLPTSPDACCTSRCCGLSSTTYCVY